MAAVIRGHPRARQKSLDAAGPAAVAGGARQLVGTRPGQRVVPPLAGDGVGADEKAPVANDPAADAGSKNDAEDGPLARRRTVGRLGEGKAIRVVGKAHRPAEGRLQVARQRAAIQPGGVCVLDKTRRRRDRAGHADPDRGRRADLPFEVYNHETIAEIVPR